MKKTIPYLIIGAIIIYLLNLQYTRELLSKVYQAFTPLLMGVFFALLLKAPIAFLERNVLVSRKIEKFRRPLSLALTVTIFLGALVALVYLIIPEVSKSIEAVKSGVQGLIDGGIASSLGLSEDISATIDKLLKEEAFKDLLPDIAALTASAVKNVINVLLGLMIGITMLASGQKLGEWIDGISLALFGEERPAFLKGATKAAVEKFSRFLGGQLIEAVIFGVASYLTFLIFKVPYALLIAVIVAVFNLVPTIGGYIGGGLGAIILLTISPQKALLFIILTFVFQQVEQFTTYPIVVGKYVGLSPFFVLTAVVVGGGLFGFWGLILSVPVVAFIYNLISVVVVKKQKEDKMLQNNTKFSE